jgi:hypothetical protein
MKPLSNSQKADISRVARLGWTRAVKLALTDETEKAWRQRESIACCGRRVSEALDDDYCALMSHFWNLVGDTKNALLWAGRAESTPKRRAMFRLEKELAKKQLPRSYAEAICQDVAKCSLAQADARHLRLVAITLRNRRP